MLLENKIVLVFSTFILVFLLLAPRSGAAPTGREVALLTEMNRVRAAHGAGPLRIDATLERAARVHSRDMLRRGYFAHGNFGRRLASLGARGPLVGENLGWGVGWRGTAQGIVASWLASPAHRANLLRPGFRRVGLGLLVGTFAGRGGTTLVTADFAGR
jgi:uncharacterized protein YkwD